MSESRSGRSEINRKLLPWEHPARDARKSWLQETQEALDRKAAQSADQDDDGSPGSI